MNDIGKKFMEYTKYEYLEPSDQSKGLKQPPLELKNPSGNPIIDLPSPGSLPFGKRTVTDVINQRRSLRKYSGTPLSIDELSYLLWCTQGIKSLIDNHATLRTVPSAGARHAFETFMLINKVEGLEPGLYRYISRQHGIARTDSTNDIKSLIVEGCFDQSFVGLSAVTFIWVADVYRMKWRYGERGYRYLHLDAGHVCQNLYLAAEGIEAGACAIAAFDDDAMNEILNLDGIEQFVIYIAAVGKK